MIVYIYMKASRKQANDGLQAVRKIIAVDWIGDSQILAGTLEDKDLEPVIVTKLLQCPQVASVEVASELHDAPHTHMTRKDWERLAQLREDTDDITPAERKEMYALLEKSNLEFIHKADPWIKSTFGAIAQAQQRFLKSLEKSCVEYETKLNKEKAPKKAPRKAPRKAPKKRS